jgi:hypothetical protein
VRSLAAPVVFTIAGDTHDIVDGLTGKLRLALGDERPAQIAARWRLMARNSSPAIGCSTDSEPLRRSTQSRERLMSNWLRHIAMASEDHGQEKRVFPDGVPRRAPCK